jgi:hypothetical protein
MKLKYPDCDFHGYATKANLTCRDKRVIMPDAFKDQDGEKVPLCWGHQHNSVTNVLGHAYLENRADGVYAYGYFNDTDSGRAGKKLVDNGDVCALSIWANDLVQNGTNVVHGVIRELSLVLAGANPGAYIDSVMQHDDEANQEAEILFVLDKDNIQLAHADSDEDSEDAELQHADEEQTDSSEEDKQDDAETVQDVLNSMTEKQRNVLLALVAEGIAAGEETKKTDNNEEDNTMKHNVFDNDRQDEANVLSYTDQTAIINMAKTSTIGSLQHAMDLFAEQNPDSVLAHGIENISQLFPDYKDVRPGAPEMLTTDQGWIQKVLKKVHKSPISRIRTRQADLRNIENLRAQGYVKGSKKVDVGNFKLIHRTTDPQTVYVKSKIDRDDIIDIQDFDVVQYLYNIDRMNLNEELATAIMIGDGRDVGADGKIAEDKIRPIWQDDELYTIHADVDIAGMKASLQGTNTAANFGENYVYAEAVIQSLLYAREKYKGSGTPDFYCTPHLVNVMLLARDMNGRRIYDKVSDLAAALNVGEIITVEQFEGKTRTATGGKTKKLLGLMGNLADYSVGATKGGEITHFTDFDIDFNQEKSLLETRCSGANTRVMSFIALEEDVTNPGG